MYSASRIIRACVSALVTGLITVSCATRKDTVLSRQEAQPPTPQTVTSTTTKPIAATRATVQAAYGKVPLHFEANQGQSNEQVKFLARGNSYTLFLTATEAVLALPQKPDTRPQQSEAERLKAKVEPQPPAVLRMQLAGANPQPHITGEDELSGKSNYFFGNDPAQWHTDIPTYAKVKYQGIYPGIDLVYYGYQQQLEYDFVVAPGTDPHVIRLAFDESVGAHSRAPLHLDTDGDLMLPTADGELRFHQPHIYQESDGVKQPITGRYVLFDSETTDSGLRTQQVGFEVAAYDPSKPLIIDPVLVYSTYLGGSNGDSGSSIAVDAEGNVYVAGTTSSADFPIASESFQTLCHNQCLVWGEAFIAKLAATGSDLIYATYLGGSQGEDIHDLVVDAEGNVYVGGTTFSNDFPTTTSAFQPASSCRHKPDEICGEAFVAKLNSQGSALLYSTYLSGSKGSGVGAIAIDTTGNVYVTGSTFSDDFPVTPGAFQSVCHLTHDDAPVCGDSFITKLNSTGSALVYSTYFGGDKNFDQSFSIAVDPSGHAYIAGSTFSDDLPTTPGALQSACAPDPVYGCFDAFVVKFNPAGSALVYFTYLGGDGRDSATSIKVDTSGNAYVAGWTFSDNFPTTRQSFQAEPCPDCSSFLAKLDPSGSEFVYSTYLSGSDATGVDIDSIGNAYVAGNLLSYSPDKVCRGGFGQFPVPCPITTALITKVNETGSTLVYTTFLGGSHVNSFRSDSASDIAIDIAGNAYVTGQTNSADFPTTTGVFQSIFAGSTDVFIAKIADRPAGIQAFFESPENGPVSGISVIRGWAFATEAGVSISSVELFIDGQSAGEVPCCSQRGDVQAAFPQFPADNTLNSGWGVVFNWGLASAGTHTVRLFIRSTNGELFVTDTPTVTVVKPGDSEYLDQFVLSGATARIGGDELAVDGIVVRDKTSQQQKRINARFRWQPSSQSFGMTQAETVVVLSSLQSPLSALVASLPTLSLGWPIVGSAQAAPGVTTFFESPVDGQVVSGVTTVRGWAFSDDPQAAIKEISLLLDGKPAGTAPCCSGRGDVAAAFPENLDAPNSGWGAVFNYGTLSAGMHTIGVQITDSTGAGQTLTHLVTVVKPGGSEFLDQFDLSRATARIEGGNIILSGVVVRDKTSQQSKTVEVWLRWFESAQGLGIVASSN